MSKIWVPRIGERVEYLAGRLGVPHVECGTIEKIRDTKTGKPFSITYLINGKWRANIQPIGNY